MNLESKFKGSPANKDFELALRRKLEVWVPSRFLAGLSPAPLNMDRASPPDVGGGERLETGGVESHPRQSPPLHPILDQSPSLQCFLLEVPVQHHIKGSTPQSVQTN